LALALVCAAAMGADGPVRHFDCGQPRAVAPSQAEGRLLILPGVGNTRFHLAGFVAAAEAQLPRFDVEVRTWGVPFMTIHNLRAHERNEATALGVAAEIADWRRAHPDAPFYLVGYSGGGGMATLVTAALPDDVSIDRLVLVAPAISPDYPLGAEVMPHVREYVVNYASERDLPVGWGTRTFGTIDQEHRERRFDRLRGSGTSGCSVTAGRPLMSRSGHAGNHLRRISAGAGEPRSCCPFSIRLSVPALRAQWARTCKES
jgi:pimeloyl-ACP methyl ester carboxylesterase